LNAERQTRNPEPGTSNSEPETPSTNLAFLIVSNYPTPTSG